MIDYEAALKDKLGMMTDMATRYFKSSGSPYPAVSFAVETMLDSDRLVELLSVFTEEYYRTVQEVSACRLLMDEAAQLVYGIESQAREEKKLGGLIANYSQAYRNQLDRLKGAWYALRDRRDHLFAVLQEIKVALYNLRPSL